MVAVIKIGVDLAVLVTLPARAIEIVVEPLITDIDKPLDVAFS